jgi:hypothetical protein
VLGPAKPDPSAGHNELFCLHDEQRIHVDVELTRRAGVPDLETVGLEAVFDEAYFLDADHFLPSIGNDET